MTFTDLTQEILKTRSACPLACSLDVYGDKWSLLVIRDIIFGKHKFGEFLRSSEGIPTNILTNRLKKLASLGLVERKPYQSRPARYSYHLTETGEALRPVILAMAGWARDNLIEKDYPTIPLVSLKAHERLIQALA